MKNCTFRIIDLIVMIHIGVNQPFSNLEVKLLSSETHSFVYFNFKASYEYFEIISCLLICFNHNLL